jgi:uncharacterized membrane protein required for colicin V production
MYLDILLAVVLVWGFVAGFRRGLVYSLFFLVGQIVAVVASLKLSQEASVYISQWFEIPTTYLPIVSFIAVYIATFGLVLLAARAIEQVLKVTQLNLFNKLAGAAVWMVMGVLLLSTAFWYLSRYEIIPEEQVTESNTYQYVEPLSPALLTGIGALLPFLEDVYDDIEQLISPEKDDNTDARTFEVV